ncbi:hypothetical protein B0O41_2782 [Propionibacteriaceae bacterium ES.041]|nr:hypothetical protein B0O41_2782 [Propionibacteriaceae bacterium ES.041]
MSAAIVSYLGISDHASPGQSPDRVREQYGDQVLGEVERIVSEAAATPIDWADGTTTLAQGGDQVRDSMARRYPGLSAEALKALRWYVTHLWR